MIRSAKEADFPEVFRIRRQVHQVHSNGRPDIFRDPADWDEFDHLLLLNLENDNFSVFVCEDDGVITGYALVKFVTSGKICISQPRYYYYIEEFGVDEGKRHHGYGSELMYGIIDHAKEHKAASVTLNVWDFNENAENFYRNFGMTTMKTDLEIEL